MLQTAAHKSRTDIFESERRAVKKFERRNVFGDFNEREIKVDGFSAYTKKNVFRDFAADKRLYHFKRDLFFGFGFKFAEKISRKRRNSFGKIQTLIGRLTVQNRLPKRRRAGLFIGAEIIHLKEISLKNVECFLSISRRQHIIIRFSFVAEIAFLFYE